VSFTEISSGLGSIISKLLPHSLHCCLYLSQSLYMGRHFIDSSPNTLISLTAVHSEELVETEKANQFVFCNYSLILRNYQTLN